LLRQTQSVEGARIERLEGSMLRWNWNVKLRILWILFLIFLDVP
jgi:hypothetical protein